MLDSACLKQAQALRKKNKITHTVAVLGLAFHTEEPNGVSYSVNIFMLPEISLAAGNEAALVAQRWYTALEYNMLTSYAGTTTLMMKQWISPVVIW